MTDARAELMQISAPGRVADAAARLHFALDLLALRGGLRLRCPWTIRTAPRARPPFRGCADPTHHL